MRALWLAFLIFGCGSGGSTLRIDLRTDFVPEDELVRTEVVLDGETQVTQTRADVDWVDGARIATFEVRGAVEARVRLIGVDEQLLAERALRADVREAVGRTVVITRDCRGVECPDACVGGRCVSRECSPELPELCPEAECDTNAECPGIAQCAVPTCIDGVCLQASGGCAVEQFCDPDTGCRTKSGAPPSCDNPIDVTGLVGEHRFSSCGFRDVGQGICSPEGAADAYFTFVTPPNMVCNVRRDNRETPVIHNISFDACQERDTCFGGFVFGVTSGGSPTRAYFSVEAENGCGEFALRFDCTSR